MNLLDITLFPWINAGAGTPMWHIHVAAFISNNLPACMLLILAALEIRRPERRRVLWIALASLVVTWIAVRLVRETWALPRPGALDVGIQWVAHSLGGGFPSLHASGAFAVAMAVLLERRDRLGVLFVLAAAAIAWSRVYLGVHFPTDVLAGAALGSLVALLMHRLAHYWQRRAPGPGRRALP